MNPIPGIRDLPVDTARELLGSVTYGRIVFSRYALPVVRPVDHILDGDQIILRTDIGINMSAESQTVAFETDSIDEETHLGWCVVVTGVADTITDADDLACYRRLLRRGMFGTHGRILRIDPDIITGIEFYAPHQPDRLLTIAR